MVEGGNTIVRMGDIKNKCKLLLYVNVDIRLGLHKFPYDVGG